MSIRVAEVAKLWRMDDKLEKRMRNYNNKGFERRIENDTETRDKLC